MFRRIKRWYYRRRARKLILTIEKGYVALHLLLSKAGYSRSERRRIVRQVVKDRSLMDRYLREETFNRRK